MLQHRPPAPLFPDLDSESSSARSLYWCSHPRGLLVHTRIPRVVLTRTCHAERYEHHYPGLLQLATKAPSARKEGYERGGSRTRSLVNHTAIPPPRDTSVQTDPTAFGLGYTNPHCQCHYGTYQHGPLPAPDRPTARTSAPQPLAKQPLPTTNPNAR
jgi:hypothetical protein